MKEWFESSLWLDRDDAGLRIDRLAAAGKVLADEAELLRQFRQEGYARTHLGLELADQMAADFDQFWSVKPKSVLYASLEPHLRRMPYASEEQNRRPGYRIHEPQSGSAAAMSLYLHPRLHRIAKLLLGERPVAMNSIAFEYGSAQALHRDPLFVSTPEPGHLVAAWIALEDVNPGAGPLMYIPRSHRLPPFALSPGRYRYTEQTLQQDVRDEQAWLTSVASREGLSVEPFLARKGDVLFWHAGLYHGGGSIKNPQRTRKSMVIHFSTARTYRVAKYKVREPEGTGESDIIYGTHRRIGQRDAIGFANPLSRNEFSIWPTIQNQVARLLTRGSR